MNHLATERAGAGHKGTGCQRGCPGRPGPRPSAVLVARLPVRAGQGEPAARRQGHHPDRNGLMVVAALEAAEKLAGQGVQARVLDMHTVKPLDDAAVLAAARETGRIVVAAEHLLHGGLGSAVAMSAARQQPVLTRFVALRVTVAESGTPE